MRLVGSLELLAGRLVGRPGPLVAAAGLLMAAVAGAVLVVRWPAAPEEPFAVVSITVQDPAPAEGKGALGAAEESRAPSAEEPPARLAPAPDPRLVERTSFGMLPRIGADGALPWKVYSRPAGPAGQAGPRVSVVVMGLGVGQGITADAIDRLPPAVSVAFAPYGADLDRSAARAREQGHEILLQVPMEPFDYPDNDPGPHTLTAKARPQDNIDRLRWVMGRFTGYVGLVNHMGAKLTADEAALRPILGEVGARGLLFLDDGSSARSVMADGGPASAPVARAQMVLEADAGPAALDRDLARLEAAAREKGRAIGTVAAGPVTIDRIARWSKELNRRGIKLVPVSSMMEGQSSR